MEELDEVVKESFFNICKYYKISSNILMQFLMQPQEKHIKTHKK